MTIIDFNEIKKKKKIKDAVIPEAKPGYKAGNSIIDDNNEKFQEQDSSDLVLKIKELIDTFTPFLEQGSKYLKNKANHIIQNKIQNTNYIERTLDEILDYAMWGYLDDTYKKLNNYLATLDKEAAKNYEDFYNELVTND
jgi:hypothetical protein